MEREEEEIIASDDKTTPAQRQPAEEDKMTDHIETRKKIRSIADVSSFSNLIEQTTLSEEDKNILYLHYLDGKDFCFIADTLGYSESTIKRRHKKALQKISKLL